MGAMQAQLLDLQGKLGPRGGPAARQVRFLLQCLTSN